MVEIIREPDRMTELAMRWRAQGEEIGFVPTMGALHEGHLSLVRAAREENTKVVVSIFVNPTQFGPNEDYEAYPRDLQSDAKKLDALGTDAIFTTDEATMYPSGYATYVVQEGLTEVLCGAFRPIHFRGVLTVCCKLFHIAKPHRAYFGQKDYQQSVVIRRMVSDLNMDLEIQVLPIVREADGIAMSSRNMYLNPEERERALCLSRALKLGEELFQAGERNAGKILAAMRERVENTEGTASDYIEIVDPDTLQRVDPVHTGDVMALAVRIGKARLIDNAILGRGI
jgi:pantoate--beta-alanine ligase